jgi:hypothetical protein
MILLQFYTSFQAIRRPGKSGPAVFTFYDPRPPLRDFTKNIDSKAKPSLHKPTTGLTSRGFCETDVFGASPVASALDQRTGREPSTPSFTLSCRVQIQTDRRGFSCKLKLRSCRMRSERGKTTLEYQNAHEKSQTGGCPRSTKFVIVVPGSSWRKIFCKQTSYQQKAEKGETRKSFEQRSS